MNIKLRKYTLDDQKDLAKQANNPDVSKYLRNIFPYPYTCIDALNFLSYITKKNIQEGFEYAIEVDGKFAGAIGVTCFDDVYCCNGEIGYWLGKDFWHQGIMSQVLEMFIKEVFNKTNVTKLTSEVFSENIASQKTLEKAGFILEGKLKDHIYKNNQYYDAYIYGLLKKDYHK